MKTIKKQNSGFTLLEILLVIGIIAILASIVIIAINPGRQLAKVRDTERRVGVTEINKALTQYYIDEGHFPVSLDTNIKNICDTGYSATSTGFECEGQADLSLLVPKYLPAIPADPTGVGYEVGLGQTGKPMIIAPLTESGPPFIAVGTTTSTTTVTVPSNFHNMSTWNREYLDGEFLPEGIYYPFSDQYGYAHGRGHPMAFDNNGKLYAPYYRGYIYSTNQGQTWTLVDLSEKIAQGGQWFSSIAVSPDGRKIWVTDRDSGVYVSRDSGVTFDIENQLTGLRLDGDLQILLSPYNSNHLIIFTSRDTGYGRRAGQLYRSTDSGTTWQSLNSAISNAGSVGPSAGTPVAFDPDDINTFYYISMISSGDAGLYVTTNGGSSFSRITSGNTYYASAVAVSNDGNGKRLMISGACVSTIHTAISDMSWSGVTGSNSYCGYDSAITVHPLDLSKVYIWLRGGYSSDGGKSVQEPTFPLSDPDSVFSMVFTDPFHTGTFYVGSYYGKIMKSTDGGANWSVVGAFPFSE